MSKKKQRKSHLTIAEKGWIVQHAEKNPSLSGRRLFRVVFRANDIITGHFYTNMGLMNDHL